MNHLRGQASASMPTFSFLSDPQGQTTKRPIDGPWQVTLFPRHTTKGVSFHPVVWLLGPRNFGGLQDTTVQACRTGAVQVSYGSKYMTQKHRGLQNIMNRTYLVWVLWSPRGRTGLCLALPAAATGTSAAPCMQERNSVVMKIPSEFGASQIYYETLVLFTLATTRDHTIVPYSWHYKQHQLFVIYLTIGYITQLQRSEFQHGF